MSMIIIAGLGIRCPNQVTAEVRRLLGEVDIVFHSVSNLSMREWIEIDSRRCARPKRPL